MKFKNKQNGVILEPRNETVLEQLQKSDDYEVFEEFASDEKPIGQMNKDELIAYAKNVGISIPNQATKAEIIAIVSGYGGA